MNTSPCKLITSKIPLTQPQLIRHLPIRDWTPKQRLFHPFTYVYCPTWVIEVLQQDKINPRHCRAKLNLDTIAIVNQASRQLIRVSLSDLGDKLLVNNFQSLSQLSFAQKPQPLKQIQASQRTISFESMVPGKNIPLQKLSSSLIEKIILAIKPLYQPSMIHTSTSKEIASLRPIQVFHSSSAQIILKELSSLLINRFPHQIELYKSPIHGDLTHDNILSSGLEFWLIDFDRSGISFIEFDSMIFDLYRQTKSHPHHQSELLFDLAINQLKNGQLSSTTKLLYQHLPQISSNQSHLLWLQSLFIYRLICYNLVNADFHALSSIVHKFTQTLNSLKY